MCIFFVNIYAQDNVLYQEIQQSKSNGEIFETFVALTNSSKSSFQSNKIQNNFIDPKEVYVMQYSKPAVNILNAAITLIIPLEGKSLQLELIEHKIEYQLTTSDNQPTPTPSMTF